MTSEELREAIGQIVNSRDTWNHLTYIENERIEVKEIMALLSANCYLKGDTEITINNTSTWICNGPSRACPIVKAGWRAVEEIKP